MKSNSNTICVVIVCVFGLFLDGYVLHIASVSIPFIQKQFEPNTWCVGLIQAAAPIGAVVGAILIGRLSDYWGRKRVLILNLIVFIVTAILSAISWDLYSLIFFRCLAGVAVGMDYPICATYLAEVSPLNKTARYMAMAMLGNCLSAPVCVIFAWSLAYYLHDIETSWRWMFFSATIPAMIAMLFRTKLYESVLWTMQKKVIQASSLTLPYKIIFSSAYRRITLILCFSWFFMHVAYFGVGLFSPLICRELISDNSIDLMLIPLNDILQYTLLMSLTACLGAFISMLYIAKWRILHVQMIGFLVSSIGLLILSLSFILNLPHRMMFSMIGLMCFNFFINLGPGVTAYLLPARVYSTDIRGTGHGLASGFAKSGAVLGAFIIPILMAAIGLYSTLLILSLFLLVGFFLTAAMPKDAYSKHDAAELSLRHQYNKIV